MSALLLLKWNWTVIKSGLTFIHSFFQQMLIGHPCAWGYSNEHNWVLPVHDLTDCAANLRATWCQDATEESLSWHGGSILIFQWGVQESHAGHAFGVLLLFLIRSAAGCGPGISRGLVPLTPQETPCLSFLGCLWLKLSPKNDSHLRRTISVKKGEWLNQSQNLLPKGLWVKKGHF